MVAGGLAVLTSGLLLTSLDPNTSLPLLLGAFALFGFGFALGQPADRQHGGVRHAAGPGRRGRGGGDDQPAGGHTLGVAVLGAVAGGGWIVAALGLTVATLGYVTTTGWAQEPRGARRTG